MAKYKTSKYTVEGPLHLGGRGRRRTGRGVRGAQRLRAALGEAFQLRDDVLGVFGDPSRTGKPAGDDLREGKRTLLVAIAMSHATEVQSALLRDCLGDRSMAEDRVAALRDVIVSTGALDQVEQRIALRADEARAALRTDAISDDANAGLAALVTAATERHT